MPQLQMNDKLRVQFTDIGAKISKLLKDEVEKVSNNSHERIVLTHTIIEFLYLSDQEAIKALGFKIKPIYKRKGE
jgi:hypothetical protein